MSGGRTGYRKKDAKGDRLTFRPTESLAQAIERHRFPGELTQPLLNRLLRNLANTNPETLPEPDLWGEKLKPVSFRPEPAVFDFCRRWEPKFRTSQHMLESVVNLATMGEAVEPLATPAAAHAFLVQRFGFERVEVAIVLQELCEHCSEKYAKNFLAILGKSGGVKLVQNMPKEGVSRIEIGRERVSYIEIRSTCH